MRGRHTLKTWSKTQGCVALSSGEAELQGIVKAASECLGVEAITRDVGVRLVGKAYIYADASAAIGMASRRGVGNVRHLDTRVLWIQETATRQKLDYLKVKGTENPADVMSTFVTSDAMGKAMHRLSLAWIGGRAKVAPNS